MKKIIPGSEAGLEKPLTEDELLAYLDENKTKRESIPVTAQYFIDNIDKRIQFYQNEISDLRELKALYENKDVLRGILLYTGMNRGLKT